MKRVTAPSTNTRHGHQDSTGTVHQRQAIKPPTKNEAFLLTLYQAGTDGLTQPEAYRVYGESCLHSSISWAANVRCLVIRRETEPHISPVGTRTHFTRYTLANDLEFTKALAIINAYRAARGVSPWKP